MAVRASMMESSQESDPADDDARASAPPTPREASRSRTRARIKRFKASFRKVKSPSFTYRRAKGAIFNRRLLVERLELEANMTTMCPRFLLVVCTSALLAVSLEISNRIADRGNINKLLTHEFDLEDVESRVVSTAQVRMCTPTGGTVHERTLTRLGATPSGDCARTPTASSALLSLTALHKNAGAYLHARVCARRVAVLPCRLRLRARPTIIPLTVINAHTPRGTTVRSRP
jgi:hypothetical protein